MFLTALDAVRVPKPHIAALFGGDPIVEALPEADMWALAAPLIYRSEARGVTITFPKGGTSDLASTPKFLQWVGFLDDDGLSRPCGIGHDLLYRLGREKSKEWCDTLLYEMCLSVGMKRWQAWVYYLAVHWFGGSGWREDSEHENYGDPRRSNFFSQADYEAFIAAGGTLYS